MLKPMLTYFRKPIDEAGCYGNKRGRIPLAAVSASVVSAV